ncbi:hypothetical protein GUJ93_ZPchr0001g32798 [Zizania palustris]|uniref:Transcription factor TFIIIC triple barrel domain-containing protein n=1 Tax=Zizania palustris TaxID=103762 RepID=A0A8J5RV52_ZIZPA|nr:hypothetical protein GUJ93_ZPchr0001g32798 [Zizania palustris]
MLQSACRSESSDLEVQLKEYQEKIKSCKEKIEKANSETISEDKLNTLQKEMEEKLQEEQLHCGNKEVDLLILLSVNTAVRDELHNLDRERVSIEQRKDVVKKKEKDMMKAQNMLSMCVSVTNIMANFEDQDKISGYIVDKNMKKLDRFEFDKTMSPVDVCNKLWDKPASGGVQRRLGLLPVLRQAVVREMTETHEEDMQFAKEEREKEEEEEYVLLELDDCLYSEVQPKTPYVLSGLDTLTPMLKLGDGLKMIGEYEETVGTCYLFSETG